jgi:hypothetical protein
MTGIGNTNIKATHSRDFHIFTSQYYSIMIEKWIGIRERIHDWIIIYLLKTNANRIIIRTKISKSIMFFGVLIINILANTEVKILSIAEVISIQKTIKDRYNGFILIPGSIIIYTTKCTNPWSNLPIYFFSR